MTGQRAVPGQARPPRGDPRARRPPGPSAARRELVGASCARGFDGHPGDGQPRHRRARPRQGHARRPPRLRLPEALGRPPPRHRRPPAPDPRRHPRRRSGAAASSSSSSASPARPASSPRPSTSRRSHEQEGTVAGDNTLLVLFPDEPRLERWLDAVRLQLASRRRGRRPQRPRRLRSMKKVVLAYSGGLDTSVAVAWLREQYDAEVVTLTVDLGGGSIREGVERRALSAGAVAGLRRRCAASVRQPVRLAAPPGERALPGRLPAGHGARPAADRAAARRGRPAARAPTRSPTAAPARATTRSGSTSRSTPSTRGSRSSRRCASGWA